MENYTDTEYRILGSLLRNPVDSRSLNQVSKDTRLSYVTVHKLVPILNRRKLIRLEIKGKSHLISIDFDNADIESLSSAMLYQKNIFMRKNIKIYLLNRDISESLSGRFYILMLFGSYAKGKQKENSDIDLLFIIPDRKSIDEYMENIERVFMLYPHIKKDFKIVSVKDFEDMLNQKYTVGREIFKNSLVLFGTEHYYAMVKKYVRTKGY
ncbi:MAG: nucleotidyltransferase domain-containing protein [Candidatus Aenigmarchaeota archaeon]|nr:nucleotidyltransferase domain-containing protein [Candidatus Aenigmarchaeota archaeon]